MRIRSRIARTLACALAGLSWSSLGWAQESSGYVGAAITTSAFASHSVDAGTPSTTYANSTTDTSLTGVAVEAGWFISPRWGVGVEFTQPLRRANLISQYGYFSPSITISRYRESVILGTARVRLAEKGYLRAELVGGAGIVRGSSLQRVSEGRFGSNTFGPFGDEREVTGQMIGAMLGADLVAAATRHVSVVPQFRMLTIRRGSVISGIPFASFGLNTIVAGGAVGIRVAF